ncbi:Arylsulfatase [Thalassoglobus neptunius]|uniref:Arylsulfatase n=1 Tax=Thalassoglobus neptunius TaxID=1938619 RepID=A0A5C5WNT1_9PLAN|nr:arylsulfatase [Thalassoglobus neptunius]TWT51875.1 Arylsulfatase [Thalassoglobus neptunius]
MPKIPALLRRFLSIAAVLLPALSLDAADRADSERPNIILIMSDDMGFSDIQPYGGEIQTPNLQQLADGGLRFTQFYNTARCCPTRASLLTGLYPHQAGIGHMMSDRKIAGYRGNLNRQCVTIAEALKPAGYSTYMSGKWHVTPHVKPDGDKSNWPLQRGFDRFYGTIHGAGSFFDPNSLTRDNTQISPYADSEYQPETYYYTDAISDHAVRFIDEHFEKPESKPIQPFFMYVAYTAAHWPMHALPEDIAKYDGVYDEGYRAIRQARLDRLKELGLVRPDTELPADAENWNEVEHREWEIACMQVYAAMVDNMDQGIGRIVEKLEELGALDDTLIFFLQDNGGCAEGLGRRPSGNLRERPESPGEAMDVAELQTDMIPNKARDGYPVVQGPGVMPGPADTYIAYGRGWANVSNTPFREYKHWVHEGGISSPLICHWPNGIFRKGELESQPGHLIDIMATCLDVAGAEYPKRIGDNEIKPFEGKSLQPAFSGQEIERDALFWEHEGNRAVRVGDWKLVAKENKPWELYDLSVDRIEANDLSAEYPARVRELEQIWDEWAARADVLPLGAWRGSQNHDHSKQTEFDLKAGADLSKSESPNLVGTAFTIRAQLESFAPDGVIVAQGGVTHGISLFVQDGVLRFAVRSGGHLEVVSSDSVIENAHQIEVIARKKGKVVLKVDGMKVGSGTIEKLLEKVPAEGLQVGLDDGDPVAKYPRRFAYDGEIEAVNIEIGPAKK